MKRSISGFTIVELLIVVVVIAILATISVVAYSGIQTRAHASAIVAELKATEKALDQYRVASGQDSWWLDDSPALTGAANPKISDLISAQPEFRAFLTKPPSTDGLITPNKWYYDNDGDTYSGCSASSAGVNLTLNNPQNADLVQAIDNAIDDGNLACGKVRKSGSNFVYGIK